MLCESVIFLESIKKGDKLSIYCYKHDGSLEHTSDSAVVLENNEDVLICGNGKTKITEKDGRSHMTNEPAILFFYKKAWFNIIGQLKKHGLYYYCNIASPFIIENNVIKYIDYDLDLRVFPDGGFRVSKLIALKKENYGPFEDGIVKKYYEMYKNLKKS